MKAAEDHLLIFEGVSAGQHVAAGAAWVDLPQANPSGRAERERASQYPQRSRPSEQRHNDERREPRRSLRSSPKDEAVGRRRGKNRQMGSALRVAEITGRGLCWLRGYSPLRGCAREAALPAAHSYRNGLYAI
jgi:hypothetical protein